MTPQVDILKLRPEATIPSYQTEGAAGLDLHACLPEGPVVAAPGRIVLIPTGLAMAIPAGFEAQVRSRSGLAIKQGLTVVNSPGTIDSDYRGEVKVGLINLGPAPVEITHGMRVVQLVIAPVARAQLREVASLDATVRGAGGFGSTGTQARQ